MPESRKNVLRQPDQWAWPFIALVPNLIAMGVSTIVFGEDIFMTATLVFCSIAIGLAIGLVARRSLVYPFASICFACVVVNSMITHIPVSPMTTFGNRNSNR